MITGIIDESGSHGRSVAMTTKRVQLNPMMRGRENKQEAPDTGLSRLCEAPF
jgi:hypothetical protein